MKLNGLIKPVLESLGLNIGTANLKCAPSKGKSPTKHVHGKHA